MTTAQVTLEELEAQIMRLPPQQQLKLVARISEQLSGMTFKESTESNEEGERQARLRSIDTWIAACDQLAELVEGEFDSAADLRRIRDEDD